MAPLRVWKYVAVLLVAVIAADVSYAKSSSSKSSGSSRSSSKGRDVSVRSYTKKDGTHVQAHHRSAPDGNFWNNWSTVGNTNPYTGKAGTISHPPLGYGSSRRNASSISGTSRAGTDQSAIDDSTADKSTTTGTTMQQPVADQPITDVAAADDPQTDVAEADDQYPHQPKVVRKPITWPPKIKWATDRMNADDRAEHARVAEFLRSHKVNLVYWDLYSLEKLHAMEKQLVTEGRVDY